MMHETRAQGQGTRIWGKGQGSCPEAKDKTKAVDPKTEAKAAKQLVA